LFDTHGEKPEVGINRRGKGIDGLKELLSAELPRATPAPLLPDQHPLPTIKGVFSPQFKISFLHLRCNKLGNALPVASEPVKDHPHTRIKAPEAHQASFTITR